MSESERSALAAVQIGKLGRPVLVFSTEPQRAPRTTLEHQLRQGQPLRELLLSSAAGCVTAQQWHGWIYERKKKSKGSSRKIQRQKRKEMQREKEVGQDLFKAIIGFAAQHVAERFIPRYTGGEPMPCGICRLPLCKGDLTRKMSCAHSCQFHAHCIVTHWERVAEDCPLCHEPDCLPSLWKTEISSEELDSVLSERGGKKDATPPRSRGTNRSGGEPCGVKRDC